jgi:membrane protein DedA with SNARE-associated domain
MMRAFLLASMRQFTYGGVFLALAIAGFGVPLPQEVTLLLTGYLLEHGRMDPRITVPVGIAGVIAGDVIGFWLIRKGAARLQSLPVLRGILTSERFARAQDALARREAVTIAVARNVTGVRTIVFATAAATGTPFGRFLLWDSLASIPNVVLLLWLGYVFSNRLGMITREVSRVEHWVAGGIVALVLLWALRAWLRRPPTPSESPALAPVPQGLENPGADGE